MKLNLEVCNMKIAATTVLLAVGLVLSCSLSAATPAGAQQALAVDDHSAFDGIWRNAGRGRRPPGAPLENCCSEEGWNDYAKYLQPWAMEVMDKRAAALKVGKPLATNTAQCRPDGTPTVIEIPYPFQFLRTPTYTYILYEADYQSRRIRMNSAHPAKTPANWYGDSIGHWEGQGAARTLVIDTVNFNDKSNPFGFIGVHSSTTHLVERFHTENDGKTLIGEFTFANVLLFRTYAVFINQIGQHEATAAAALSFASFIATWVAMLIVLVAGSRKQGGR
jgi:hypothetical protein